MGPKQLHDIRRWPVIVWLLIPGNLIAVAFMARELM